MGEHCSVSVFDPATGKTDVYVLDSYQVLTAKGWEISSWQQWDNGTCQLTIKRTEPEAAGNQTKPDRAESINQKDGV